VTIRRTIISLLVAPLGAVAVTILGVMWDHGTVPLWFALTAVPLFILVLGWVVGLVIVLPIMIRWPLLRQPTKLKAAASTVLIAWMPEVVTRIQSGSWDRWQALVFVTVAGAATCLLYSSCAASTRQPAPP
jgi:tetrahydromethanopterin S-methyltransferase subunit C